MGSSITKSSLTHHCSRYEAFYSCQGSPEVGLQKNSVVKVTDELTKLRPSMAMSTETDLVQPWRWQRPAFWGSVLCVINQARVSSFLGFCQRRINLEPRGPKMGAHFNLKRISQRQYLLGRPFLARAGFAPSWALWTSYFRIRSYIVSLLK